MNVVGMIIGAIVGFVLLHHPIGIFLGAFVGYLFHAGGPRLTSPAHADSRAFILPLFGLAGAIAKSDGRVSEPEIAATENLMSRMQLNTTQRNAAIEQFNAGKQNGFAVHIAIAELKAWCGGRRDLAYLLLDMLLDIVYAEGALAADKLSLVRKLCWAVGVHERELAALAAMKGYAYAQPGAGRYQSSQPPPRNTTSGKDPYAVLGLDRNASDREIKNAYRKLISQHHPDKLGDVPDELKRRAEQRAGEINAAYETLREQRGIK